MGGEELWESFEQGGPWSRGSCQKNLMGRGSWPEGPMDLQPGFGDSHLRLGDGMHLRGLRLTSVFLNRARRVFMASVQCFSSTQATWERTGGQGIGLGEQEGLQPSPPQKDHVLPPGPPWPLEQDTDMPHLLTTVCPSAGHVSHLSFTSLTLKIRKIPLLTNSWLVFSAVCSIGSANSRGSKMHFIGISCDPRRSGVFLVPKLWTVQLFLPKMPFLPGWYGSAFEHRPRN